MGLHFSSKKVNKKNPCHCLPVSQFEAVATEPEVIPVDVNEILSRWQPWTERSLRELRCLNNSHFEAANVLGKVVNLLRQSVAQTTREIDKWPPITVPGYYRPGILMITKSISRKK